MDVGDWWRGVLSSRRLVALTRHLSDESATKKAMGDGWSLLTHLVVSVVNEQRMARADYASAHGESMKPTLIPRPGEQSTEAGREQARDVHDALMSMMSPDPELEDARARLRREQAQAPQVEIDAPVGG